MIVPNNGHYKLCSNQSKVLKSVNFFVVCAGFLKVKPDHRKKNELQSKQSLVNNVSVNFDFNYNSPILSKKKLFSD